MPTRFPLYVLAITLCAPAAGSGQVSDPLLFLTNPVELPMISFTTIGLLTDLSPIDVREIEISSSGDYTDVFLRLFEPAARELAEWSTPTEGFRMIVSICSTRVLKVESLSPMTTGTLYIPNLTFVQADALRSIWHGRATCSTLPPEVFSSGQ